MTTSCDSFSEPTIKASWKWVNRPKPQLASEMSIRTPTRLRLIKPNTYNTDNHYTNSLGCKSQTPESSIGGVIESPVKMSAQVASQVASQYTFLDAEDTWPCVYHRQISVRRTLRTVYAECPLLWSEHENTVFMGIKVFFYTIRHLS